MWSSRSNRSKVRTLPALSIQKQLQATHTSRWRSAFQIGVSSHAFDHPSGSAWPETQAQAVPSAASASGPPSFLISLDDLSPVKCTVNTE